MTALISEFGLSPGISFTEVDATITTPAIDTTAGAFAGTFRWGPVNDPVLITSENDLVAKFGKPTDLNAETWFSAANFLAYSNALYLVRAANTSTQFAAVAGNTVAAAANNTIFNLDDFATKQATLSSNYVAKWPGALGDSLKVAVCETASQFNSSINLRTAPEGRGPNTGVVSSITVVAPGRLYANTDTFVVTAGVGGTNATGNLVTNATGNVVSVSITSAGAGFTSASPAVTITTANGLSAALSTTISLNTIGSLLFDNANTKIAIAVGTSNALVTLYGNSQLMIGATPLPTANAISNLITLGDTVEVQSANGNKQRLKVLSKGSIAVANAAGVNSGIATFSITFDQPLKVEADIDTNTIVRFWEYSSLFDAAPGRSAFVTANGNTALQIANSAAQNDELHIAVVDEDGLISGTIGGVLERYSGVSRATNAKTSDGATNYYKTVINNNSLYVWAGSDRTGAETNTAVNIASATTTAPAALSFVGGVDASEDNIAFSSIAAAYDKFTSVENIDVSLIISGKPRGTNGTQLANYLIDNVAEVRKDCVVFISPERSDVVGTQTPAQNVVDFRNNVRSSSYAVLDSGYKYQYDKYNDVYRYIPLNADIAGLCVRTDATRDPWFSPAGVNRGSIRNVIKLPFNPKTSERDLLYKNGVNPVITQQGIGTILFGDKTLLATPSAFDRINVRRLFISLQKTITQASNSLLFEFNDEFTRAQFVNIVEPYLRDVQARRGITDFKVVCDETNNTPQVVDTNRFVGDIYVKPARAINFIRLNFVAVRSGVEFTEVVGQ
jgi:hypothetical protein